MTDNLDDDTKNRFLTIIENEATRLTRLIDDILLLSTIENKTKKKVEKVDLFEVFEGERIDRKNTHGTGCTISSAITSHLALGYDIKEAVRLSKEYITEAIRHSFDIGKGVGPVHHFYKF